MAARSGRRYRLIRATVAVGVLFPFVLAGIGPGDEPSTATPTVPGSAESAPVPPGIAPAAVRIKLDAAAPGVTTRTGVPAEVPLVADFPGRESARVLTLTREGLEPFRAVGVTWAGAGATPVSVAVRTRTAKGPWTGWQAADRAAGSDAAAPGTRDGAELLWVGPCPGSSPPTGRPRPPSWPRCATARTR